MKRIILLAVVALAVNAAYAQKVQFGVKAGVNLANFNEDISPNSNSKAGLNIGALAHIHLNKNWAIQPEAVYSMQGAEYSNSSTKIKVNYVNIPVLAQYMFANGFRLQTGPQLGILTNSKVKYNGAVEVDSDNNYKNTDFGWAFGAGYLTKAGFGLDARYNLGISDISKTDPSDLKNRVWQFGVFYQFRH